MGSLLSGGKMPVHKTLPPAPYYIRTPGTPYRLSINGILTATVHLMCCRWPISWISGPKCWKSLKITKIRVSNGLKSKYLQLWAEYSIITLETPYILSINGLLTVIGHLRCCRWPISWIYQTSRSKPVTDWLARLCFIGSFQILSVLGQTKEIVLSNNVSISLCSLT